MRAMGFASSLSEYDPVVSQTLNQANRASPSGGRGGGKAECPSFNETTRERSSSRQYDLLQQSLDTDTVTHLRLPAASPEAA